MAADRNLLFGLLALQNGLIDQDQLVDAFRAWTRDKNRSIADHLVARGVFDAEQRAAVEALAALHLKKHGGLVEQSLAALVVGRSTRESLARVGEPEVEGTLTRVGSALTHPEDVNDDRTTTFSVGSATSEGQRFRVLRPHAQGGLGAVFVALDTELHREVALKQILDLHADDPISRQRFLNEAEITGGLEHPGIVPVHGLGTHSDGRPYYAMRFIRGDSLKEAIARFHNRDSSKGDPGGRSLEFLDLLRRFIDVCNAIEYAHSRGVLHRDIKPGNIIVGKHGETLVVDWGLAKARGRADIVEAAEERPIVPHSSSGSVETLPGSALGTPAYMSPEQARGDLEHLGPQSDVYSLGATFYCLLTGRPPFENDDVGAMLRAVQTGVLTPPRRVDASIDRALEAICLKAMALRPEDRYPAPKALAGDLERWVADEPVTAYRDRFSTRTARWMRRHRPLVAGAAALLLTAVVSLGASTVLINRERSKAEANFRQARAAVDEYFTTVSESTLLNVPGLQPLRKQLLDAARKYYEGFLKNHRDDRSVRAEAASALFRVGWITLTIDQPKNAMAPIQSATALYEELCRENPGNLEYQRLWATCHGALGLLLGDLNTGDQAIREHQQALQIRETIAKADPGDPRSQSDIARTHRNLGSIYRSFGKTDQALAEWDKAIAIGQPLLKNSLPHATGQVDLTGRSDLSAIVREDLAGVLLDRCGVLRDAGRHAQAQDSWRQALELFEALARDRPTDRIRGRVADCYSEGSLIALDRGRLDESYQRLRQATEIREQLVAANPAVVGWRSALVDELFKLGWIQNQRGRRADALEIYRRATDLAEALNAAQPESAGFRSLLALILTQRGNLLVTAGRAAEALPMSRRALEMQQAIARDQPDSIGHRGALSNVLRGVGRAEAATGQQDQAFQSFERASEIDRSLAESYPSSRYNLACTLALMIPVADPPRREAIAAQAIAALRRAIADGYANAPSVKIDSDLDALRPRADFKSILAEFEAKAVAGQ